MGANHGGDGGDMSPPNLGPAGTGGDAEGDMSPPHIHLIAVSKSKDKDQPSWMPRYPSVHAIHKIYLNSSPSDSCIFKW